MRKWLRILERRTIGIFGLDFGSDHCSIKFAYGSELTTDDPFVWATSSFLKNEPIET